MAVFVAVLALIAVLVVLAQRGTTRTGASSAKPTPTVAARPHKRRHRHRLLAGHVTLSQPVPILCDHNVQPVLGGPAILYIDPKLCLAAQIEYLGHHGYRVVTLAQVWAAWHGGGSLPRHPLVLSFDDGYVNQYRYAAPVLRRLHVPGVLNLVVHNMGRAFTIAEVKRMIAGGWEVDSHTITHRDLTRIPRSQLYYELKGSRNVLQRTFHVPVDFFCYPGGNYDARVIAAVRAAGYEVATTVHYGLAATPAASRPTRCPGSAWSGASRRRRCCARSSGRRCSGIGQRLDDGISPVLSGHERSGTAIRSRGARPHACGKRSDRTSFGQADRPPLTHVKVRLLLHQLDCSILARSPRQSDAGTSGHEATMLGKRKQLEQALTPASGVVAVATILEAHSWYASSSGALLIGSTSHHKVRVRVERRAQSRSRSPSSRRSGCTCRSRAGAAGSPTTRTIATQSRSKRTRSCPPGSNPPLLARDSLNRRPRNLTRRSSGRRPERAKGNRREPTADPRGPTSTISWQSLASCATAAS